MSKAIVVYPKVARIDMSSQDGLGYWTPEGINRLFDELAKSYRVNTKRIYITGLSFGGGGTWYYANSNTRSEYNPAAIVPVCNGLDENARVTGNARMPVWTFQCFDDPVVPYIETIKTMERITGVSVIMASYPYGTNSTASDGDCTISYANSSGLGAWKKNYYLADGTYTYTMFRAGGHNAWDRAYANDELWAWLFAQARE